MQAAHDDMPLAPRVTLGDGSPQSERARRRELAGMVRRIAVEALNNGQDDILLAVYIAGAAHAVAMLERRQGSSK